MEDSSARLERWLGDGEMDPGQKILRQEQVLRLASALGRLPEDQRLAVELRHLQNFSLRLICQVMDKTPAAVAGLLRRGLRQLRLFLAEETN